MVGTLDPSRSSRALDVACGTGSITRLLDRRGARVISIDQSAEMLAAAANRGATGVQASAEWLPFRDDTFDVVTFGYLLRYVDSVPEAMVELARVLRPGGMIGMVEFGRPRGMWRAPWWLYTRLALPSAGILIRHGWFDVGRFLGPSIDLFVDEHPPEALIRDWESAGLEEVRMTMLSLGGGMVMTGRKA